MLTPDQERQHAAAVRVKDEIAEEFLARPGVTGVGVARKQVAGRATEVIAVRFYVRAKRAVDPALGLPREVGGIPTDVVVWDPAPFDAETLEAERAGCALEAADADTKKYDPLVGGISIGVKDSGTTGTLGLMVEEYVYQKPVMLSAAHVLFPDGGSQEGDYEDGGRICQPSGPDSTFFCSDCARSSEGYIGEVAMPDGKVYGIDAAWAELTASRASNMGYIEDLDYVAGEAAASYLDMVAQKRGCRTGVTIGRVTDVSADLVNRADVVMANQTVVEPTDGSDEFLVSGDSGSVLCDGETNAVTGLLWGSKTSDSSLAVASPIAAVLSRLSLEIKTDEIVPAT